MYEATPDPYVYAGTTVLKNRLGIRDPLRLQQFEAEILLQRASEPLPQGRFDAAHYRAVHRHLFGDVYRWAGRYRTIRISKQDSVFCYPENIKAEMERLFGRLRTQDRLVGLSTDQFAVRAASLLATLNAIHPFREGNGRCQMTFLALLAARAGHPLDATKLDGTVFVESMIRSFFGDEAPLAEQLRNVLD